MKKIYIKRHPPEYGAGFWIYRGYASAWENEGYKVYFFDTLEEVNDNDYLVMTTDASVTDKNIRVIEKSNKTFLYVQPSTFPDPWGKHPNFQSLCQPSTRSSLNNLKNVVQWTYGDVTEYHTLWNDPKTFPLAFDHLNYKRQEGEYLYDVCFVGGIANNGFNEKISIMIEHLKAFKEEHDKSLLRCGFFIGKNLSHEQEEKILSCSKVCINIHDAYQRFLGLDTNERTFKTLGLNGALVSDSVSQLSRLFPDVLTSSDPKQMVAHVKEIIEKPKADLMQIKEYNRQNILDNHTYVCRVKQMEQA